MSTADPVDLLSEEDVLDVVDTSRHERRVVVPAGPRIIRLSDVEPEEVEFLWDPYLPLRKLTVLEGDPGTGKTFLALEIAARISQGEPIGQTPTEAGNVLYWSAEDGIADTLRPRLDAAGGDPARIHVLEPELPSGQSLTLDSEAAIRAALEEVRPALFVVDPLQGALGSHVDLHRANEVRPRLRRLLKLAEEYVTAVLLIRHLSKAATSKAVHRGLGSIDFSAAARSILLVGRVRDGDTRAVVQTKCSIAEHGPALEFTITAGRVAWADGPSTVTAASLLASEQNEEELTAQDEAAEFLKTVLADGPTAASAVLKQAGAVGIAERTLRRAKSALKVRSQKVPNDGPWTWTLPPKPDAPKPDSPTSGNLGSLGSLPVTKPKTAGSPAGSLGNLGSDAEPQQPRQDCQQCQDGHPLHAELRDLTATPTIADTEDGE